MKKHKNSLKIMFGLLISFGFLFLAFRQLELQKMKESFLEGNYWLLIPSLVIIFASHWLRSIRWQYLLNPVQKVPIRNLFSALLIGYAANDILPAHLGEFLRAYVIGRKRSIPASSALATIIVERIIDIFFLLGAMLLAIFIYPFPKTKEHSVSGIFKFFGIDKLSVQDLVTLSGYFLFIFSIVLLVFLVILKKYTDPTMRFIGNLFRPFPSGLSERIKNVSLSFLNGLKLMNRKQDYFFIVILSLLIWACYWGVLYLNFYTFNLVADYHLNITAGLVLLVITTISVVVPSSPGYIGTYHWLCQVSLELFQVPRAVGLTYAIVVHAINFFPVFIVGFILAWKEGIKLSKVQKEL